MTEEIMLSPREKEVLKALASARTLSDGFGNKKREELSRAARDTELSTPLLNICQAFAKTITFTDKELFLLNYISAYHKRSPKDFAISRMLVNEPYIAETYKDAMEKYAALTPNYKAPCNVERLLSLGSEAVRFGTPREYANTDLSIFAGKNTSAKRIDCALRGYLPKNDDGIFERVDCPKRLDRKISSCKAMIIYTRDSEKASDLEDFFSHSDNVSGSAHAFACPTEELYGKILSLGTGVSINADEIPDASLLPNMPNDYRAVINTSLALFDRAIFGETAVVVIAPSKAIGSILIEASKKGLSVCRALSLSKQENFSITSKGLTVLSLPLSLLGAIREMIGHPATIVTHDHAALKKETQVEKIFEDEKGHNAAYRTSFSISSSAAPFHQAIYSALSLILSASRDGFDLTNGDMTFSIRASLSLTDPKAIGAALAAILGIYRIETEFCIPDENSVVEYSSDQSEMLIYLRASSNKKREKSEKYSSVDPILFSSLDENSLPDLKILRDFAFGKCFPDIISDGND